MFSFSLLSSRVPVLSFFLHSVGAGISVSVHSFPIPLIQPAIPAALDLSPFSSLLLSLNNSNKQPLASLEGSFRPISQLHASHFRPTIQNPKVEQHRRPLARRLQATNTDRIIFGRHPHNEHHQHRTECDERESEDPAQEASYLHKNVFQQTGDYISSTGDRPQIDLLCCYPPDCLAATSPPTNIATAASARGIRGRKV